jgi:hypothetical protein
MSGATPNEPDKRAEDKRSGAGAQAASKAMSKIVRRAFGRQGFAEPGVLLRWHEIVGDTLARFTLPERLSFPYGERSQGTLHLKVDGQFALEVQHLEPMIVERINTFFGYGAVAKIAILQAPIPDDAMPRKRSRDAKGQSDRTAPAKDESLEDALRRFGAHFDDSPGSKSKAG